MSEEVLKIDSILNAMIDKGYSLDIAWPLDSGRRAVAELLAHRNNRGQKLGVKSPWEPTRSNASSLVQLRQCVPNVKCCDTRARIGRARDPKGMRVALVIGIILKLDPHPVGGRGAAGSRLDNMGQGLNHQKLGEHHHS